MHMQLCMCGCCVARVPIAAVDCCCVIVIFGVCDGLILPLLLFTITCYGYAYICMCICTYNVYFCLCAGARRRLSCLRFLHSDAARVQSG